MRIAARIENTRKAKQKVPPWNSRSARRWKRTRAANRPWRPWGSSGGAGASTTGALIGRTPVLETGSVPGPDGLAVGLDLGPPGALDQGDHLVWHRHVVELARHGGAIVVRPVEELQHRVRRLRLRRVLVDQDEAGSGDRPGLRPGLVGQQQVEPRRLRPVGVRRRRLEALGARLRDRKSTRLNSSHQIISYAVF